MSRRHTLVEAEAIIAWMQLPVSDREESPLTPKQRELMERWNVADNLFREHMSEKRTVEFLMDKFGYSESSARRDLDCARRVWGTRPRADKDYLANTMIDYLFECMVKAGKDRKWRDVEKLAGRIESLAGIGVKEDEPDDPLALKEPVLIVPVYDPKIIGETGMSDEERIALTRRLLQAKRDIGIIDIEAEVVPPPERDE